jgi:magnesium-transporting ATPase (P-type)
MLRGCTLRNIQYCYGVCCYVGENTKIFKNSKKAAPKVSFVMKMMNNMLLTVFALQLLIIICFSLLSLKWMGDNSSVLTYLPLRGRIDNYGLAFVI